MKKKPECTLLQQLSFAPCIHKQTFACTRNGGHVWVSTGCEGRFRCGKAVLECGRGKRYCPCESNNARKQNAAAPPSPALRVALVMHGKVGIWSASASMLQEWAEKGNDVRQQTAEINTPKGRWRRMTREQRAEAGRSYDLWPESSLQGFIRFAHASIWRHVVMANRAAGVDLQIFLHSWHPSLRQLLDELYAPEASMHEAAVPLSLLGKVQSQHLSMSRGLALCEHAARASNRPFDLIMVARYDLMFLSDFLLANLTRTSVPTLWLPHWCKSPFGLSEREAIDLIGACGFRNPRMAAAEHYGGGYLAMQPNTRVHMGRWFAPSKVAAPFENEIVLDWWFVAPPKLAASFRAIYERYPEYREALQPRAGRLENGKPRAIPDWSHFYWYHHIHVNSIPTRHVLWEGVDFMLAKSWYGGTSCYPELSKETADRIYAIAAKGALCTPGGTPGNRTCERLVPDFSTSQCPSDERNAHGVRLRCKWNSPACGDVLPARMLAIEQTVYSIMNATTRLAPAVRKSAGFFARLRPKFGRRPLLCRPAPWSLIDPAPGADCVIGGERDARTRTRDFRKGRGVYESK